jgi:hydroxymethylpyrimidine kinase / phosphomethylpyrimidine kinase / thiamine-phosphate diphosphorylase
MNKVLTIAASDSGGGAGIQADLKTILSLGGYGMSVVTAVTAQNTLGIHGITHISPSFVGLQLDAVLGDIGADCVKTGALINADIVRVTAEKIKRYQLAKLVVDPVLLSKRGTVLLDEPGRDALVKELFPLSFVLTPNIPEAEILAGMPINGLDDMKRAAKTLRAMGPKYVLVKGGHLHEDAVDVLHDGSRDYEFSTRRVLTRHDHGTGCTLASAIATLLARGSNVMESIDEAKRYLYRALRFSLNIGRGIGSANHYASITREIARSQVMEQLVRALERLKRLNIGRLIPEVQSNLAYAIPFAESVQDVASFPGLIIAMGSTIATVTAPRFGTANQINQLVLAAMEYDPEKRAAMTIMYSDSMVKKIRSLGYSVAEFDRTRTPPDLEREEGSTLAWGVLDVIDELGKVPDAVFDRGAIGKVPLIRIFGLNPRSIVDLIAKL